MKTKKRFLSILLSLVLLLGLMPGMSLTASAAETIDSGTKGSLSWTLDDEGTLFISGSGEVPDNAFWNATWGNATKVKKIVTDESSTISKLNKMSYACYSSNTPLSEVEINTTVPLTLANNAFFYRSNNAVNYTINAPEITEIGQKMIFDYSNNAVNIVFNVEKPIKFYKGTFTNLNSSSSFTIPAGSVIYIPAGYVFTDSDYQEDFNMFTNNGTIEVDTYFSMNSNLREGVDYTYNEEAQEILLTAENTNQVFGSASVTFYDILTAENITAENITIADFTYDGTAKTPVLKYGDTTLVKDTDYTIVATEGDNTSATNAGTYTIHINGINDYAGENVELSWKINKADVNVTADAKSRKYGETDPPLTYTADDLFGNDTFTGALTRAEGETVDTYAITQGTLSAGDNYNINFTGANFTITKADASPAAVTGLTAAYGSTLADVTLPDGWAWDAPATSVGNVGNNAFSATFTPANPNYNTYTTDLTVTVTAIPATPAAVAALNATYGQTLADVALPAVDGGIWAWKDVDTTSVGNAGTQTFTAVYTPTSANYTAIERNITINVAKANPTAVAPTGLTAIYGQTLANVTLTNPTGNTAGSWAWVDALTTSVGAPGNHTFKANFTPTDTTNYNSKSNIDVTVTVGKANAAAATVTANNRTYDGTEKPLVTVTGEPTGGTMQYALGTATEATEQYTTSIPTATNAGTYYVWYMVKGDANHTDTEPACVTTAIRGVISATVTFKVVNGSWDDETTADKTVTLTGLEGDTLKLAANQIPAAGSKPNDTYKAGSWDVTPSTETAITEATTYTYAYAQKDAAVVTKAPTAKALTYTGSSQELVTAGSASGGTMQYALGADATTAPKEGWNASVPTGTEVGTYYVWYKIVGDENHTDTAPAGPVTVTIAEAPETEIKVEQQALTAVPRELAGIYNTLGQMETVMRQKMSINGLPVIAEQTAFYDVELMVSFDGGTTWSKATEENFPAGGLPVTLSYPEGTNGEEFDFSVSHMFTVTSDRLGTKAGDVETPAVTKTTKGLKVTLKGLSPVAIAWKAKAAAPTPTTAPTAAPTKVPQTGDTSAPFLWLALVLLGILGLSIGGLAFVNRRK